MNIASDGDAVIGPRLFEQANKTILLVEKISPKLHPGPRLQHTTFTMHRFLLSKNLLGTAG